MKRIRQVDHHAVLTALIALIALTAADSAVAGGFLVDAPSDDRWHYPFNFDPGGKQRVQCFTSVGNAQLFVGFNDRDGVMIIKWDTSAVIPTGFPLSRYDIQSITVTLKHPANATWIPDLTPDPFYTFDMNYDQVINGDGVCCGLPGDVDGESDDPDPGRPLEMFGAGFTSPLSISNWVEGDIYQGATCGFADPDSCINNPRNPFPFVFLEDTTTKLHVEDNVKGTHNESVDVFQFTPVPWAIGVPIDYTPGNQPDPFDIVFAVNLSLSGGRVKERLESQLRSGEIAFVVTAMKEAEQGTFDNPTFYSKEATDFGAAAPALTVILTRFANGDIDPDGVVALSDHAALAECMGGPDVCPEPAAPLSGDLCLWIFDFDEDDDVDAEDAAEFMVLFGDGM